MKKRVSKKIIKKENLKLYFLIGLASLIIFIYFLIDLHYHLAFFNLDAKLNFLASQIDNQVIINISKVITNLFDPLAFIILSLIITTYFIYKKRNREAISYIIITCVAFGLVNLIKILVHRIRPENALVSENTFSFPSSHAVMAVIFFGFLVYLIELHTKSKVKKEILSGLALLFVLVVGLTRIILSVHWFSDVLAGFMLGIFLLFSYIILLKKDHLIK